MGYEFKCAARSSDALPHCPLVAASAVTQRNNLPGAKGQPPPNNFMFRCRSLSTGKIFVTSLYSANSNSDSTAPAISLATFPSWVADQWEQNTRVSAGSVASTRVSSRVLHPLVGNEAPRRDPIIRTQFSWLAGNLP